ncbi:hypothetical protein GGF31_007700 [Allomyces arbusculus]|nr:hypothetical protein GGF31_007700 [Allomyces arbusculus]
MQDPGAAGTADMAAVRHARDAPPHVGASATSTAAGAVAPTPASDQNRGRANVQAPATPSHSAQPAVPVRPTTALDGHRTDGPAATTAPAPAAAISAAVAALPHGAELVGDAARFHDHRLLVRGGSAASAPAAPTPTNALPTPASTTASVPYPVPKLADSTPTFSRATFAMSPEPVPGASTASSVLTTAAAAAAARAAIEPLTSPTMRPRALDLHQHDAWPGTAFRKPGADPTAWTGTAPTSGTWPRTTTPPFGTPGATGITATNTRGAVGRTASYPSAMPRRGAIPNDWHDHVDWPTSSSTPLGAEPAASFTSTSSYGGPEVDRSWLAARARASWHAVTDDDYYADATVGEAGAAAAAAAAQYAELADFAARGGNGGGGGVGGDAVGWHANTTSASWLHHDLQHSASADPKPVPYPLLHTNTHYHHHHHQQQQQQQQQLQQHQQYQFQYHESPYQQNSYQSTQFQQHQHLQNQYLHQQQQQYLTSQYSQHQQHHHQFHHQLPTSSGPRFGHGGAHYGTGAPTTTSSKPAKVFVSYLPPHYTVDDVARVFGQFGTIVSIKLLPTPNAALLPLKYRCGFVQFDSDLAVQACIQALHQRHVAVAGKRYILTVRDASAQAPMNTTNLMVKNLPASLDEQRLRIEFAKYGPVTSVRIIRDRDRDHGGHQRHSTGGFAGKALGFVNFRHSADATRALHGMHNAYLDGRRLHVSFAEKEYPYNVHVFDHDPLAPAGSAGSGAEDVLELDSFGIPVAPPPTAGEVAAVTEVYPTPEMTRTGGGAGSAQQQIAASVVSATAMAARFAHRGTSPGAWIESNDAVSPEVQLRRAMLHHVAHRRGTSSSTSGATAGPLSLPTITSATRTANPALALPIPETAASWAGPMSPTWPAPTAAHGPMSPPPSATFQGGVSTSQAVSWYPAHDATDLPSAMDRLQLGSDASARSGADAESMGPHRLLICNLHASVTDAFLMKSFAEAVACHVDSLTHSASVEFLTKAAGLRAAATLYPTLNPAHLASYLVPIATTTMASPVAALTVLPTSTASWTAPPRPIARFAPSSTTSIMTQSSAGSVSGSGAAAAAAMPVMPWEHEADTYLAAGPPTTTATSAGVARSESSSVPTLIGMASPPITPLVDRFGAAAAAAWNAPSSTTSTSASVAHTADEAETASSAGAHALGAPPALMSDLMAVLDRGE